MKSCDNEIYCDNVVYFDVPTTCACVGQIGFSDVSEVFLAEGSTHSVVVSRTSGTDAISATLSISGSTDLCKLEGDIQDVAVDFAANDSTDKSFSVVCEDDAVFTLAEVTLSLASSTTGLVDATKNSIVINNQENECFASNGANVCDDHTGKLSKIPFEITGSNGDKYPCTLFQSVNSNEPSAFGLRCRGDAPISLGEATVKAIDDKATAEDTFVELDTISGSGTISGKDYSGTITVSGKWFNYDGFKYYTLKVASTDVALTLLNVEFTGKGDELTSTETPVSVDTGNPSSPMDMDMITPVDYNTKLVYGEALHHCTVQGYDGLFVDILCYETKFETTMKKEDTAQCGVSGSGYYDCAFVDTSLNMSDVDAFYCGGRDSTLAYTCDGTWRQGFCNAVVSNVCGVGQGEISSTCQKDNAIVNDFFCEVPKPSVKTCNATCSGIWTGAETCTRKESNTDQCGTANSGINKPVCVDGNGDALADDKCDASLKDAAQTECAVECFGTWEVEDNNCTGLCGSVGGTKTISCEDEGSVIDTMNCDMSAKPSDVCMECTGYWEYSAFGKCEECGKASIQSRLGVCYTGSGMSKRSVGSEYCEPDEKILTQNCNVACPVWELPADWDTTQCDNLLCLRYGSKASRVKTATCVIKGDSSLSEDCAGYNIVNQVVDLSETCPGLNNCEAEYIYNEWGTCDQYCSYMKNEEKEIGSQTRTTVKCVEYTNPADKTQMVTVVSDVVDVCGSAVLEQACNEFDCDSQWTIGLWGETCSENCGTGEVTREVACVYSKDGLLVEIPSESENTYCTATKPDTKKDCTVYDTAAETCSVDFNFSWTACSETCGGGVKTMVYDSVPCAVNGEDESDLATCKAIFKIVNPNDDEEAVCNTDPCVNQTVSYEWTPATEGECVSADSYKCGYGTKTQGHECTKSISENDVVIKTGLPADESDCVAADKPSDIVSACTFEQACYSYAWLVSEDYGECNAVCGGTKSKEISCKGTHVVSSDVTTVSVGFCADAELPTGLTMDCDACVYEWTEPAFDGECIADNCTSGMKYRKVTCERDIDGVKTTVSDALCTETKPAVEESCTPVCTTYKWVAANFATCTLTDSTATCGDGTKTRTVTCKQYDNDVFAADVADEKCTATKPVASSACVIACPEEPKYVFEWKVDNWGACDKECRVNVGDDYGTKKRRLTCFRSELDSSDVEVVDSKIEVDVVECEKRSEESYVSEAACDFTPLCPSYVWIEIGDWSACSNDCTTDGEDAPFKTQSVVCVDENKCSSVDCAVNDSLCDLNAKPTNVADCTGLPKCYIPTKWEHNTVALTDACVNTAPDGKVQCGQEYTEVTKTCELMDGTTVEDKMCAELDAVADYVSCPRYCNKSYYFTTGNWAGCSSDSCATGKQYRNRECVKELSNRRLRYLATSNVDESECMDFGLTPPATTQSCRGKTDAECTNYEWSYTWSECSAPCGGGKKTSTAVCRETIADVVATDEALCTDTKMTIDSCNNVKCPSFTWVSGDWSDCSLPCGDDARLTRTVKCVNDDGVRVSNQKCDSAIKPISEKECVVGEGYTVACAQDVFYYIVNGYGACEPKNVEDNCGPGTATPLTEKTICMKKPKEGGDDVVETLGECGFYIGDAPSRSCNAGPCETYRWAIKSKGECSVPCGGGELFNTLKCINSKGATVPETNCEDNAENTKPATVETCNEAACNFCESTTCNSESNENNTCNSVTEECECKGVWSGEFCQTSQFCNGVLDKDSECCESVIDGEGVCCAAGAIVVDGECCASGETNGCGQCKDSTNMDAKLIPGTDECCANGKIDSSFYCCLDNEIDECGVCGGDSACVSKAALTESKILNYANCDEYYAAMANTESVEYQTEVDATSKLMDVEPKYVTINNFICEVIDDRRRARVLIDTSLFKVSMEASIASANDGKSASERAEEIAKAISENAPGIESEVSIGGVCGDGVCHIDETCMDGGEDCCAADCPIVEKCEAPGFSDEQCGGLIRGKCVTGLCDCFKGYTGETCGECATGYFMDGDNKCIKLTIGFKVQETCEDGILNNGESQIDCGGLYCTACPEVDDDDSNSTWVIIFMILATCGIIGCIIYVIRLNTEEDKSYAAPAATPAPVDFVLNPVDEKKEAIVEAESAPQDNDDVKEGESDEVAIDMSVEEENNVAEDAPIEDEELPGEDNDVKAAVIPSIAPENVPGEESEDVKADANNDEELI
eukprot:TRINITY_DN315_c1_g5_i1.p1 TRINITY_DN315_c1_g5~~TRINITY_DN315_c1_g5_i1.p1  ORF type:complete len:2511 (-),score=936.25 TRINITY_DN315_c1_g5_i1:628-7266(-)